jgi:hypothetical protein
MCAKHIMPENSYKKFQHSKTANQECSDTWHWHPDREFVLWRLTAVRWNVHWLLYTFGRTQLLHACFFGIAINEISVSYWNRLLSELHDIPIVAATLCFWLVGIYMYSLLYCLTETVHEITMLLCVSEFVCLSVCVWVCVCVCVCVCARVLVLISELTFAVWELKSGMKKNLETWRTPQLSCRKSRACIVYGGYGDPVWWRGSPQHVFCSKFEIYIYVSAIFMRFKTLGEPPVPSLCELFKMDLTHIQFFVYLLWQRSVCIEFYISASIQN